MSTDRIRSLEKELQNLSNKPKTSTTGRKKVDILNEIADKSKSSDFALAKKYAEQARTLAEGLSYKKGIAKNSLIFGYFCYAKSDYDNALDYCRRAQQIYEEISDNNGMARSLMNIGTIYATQSKYRQATVSYSKALRIFEDSHNQEGLATIYLEIGNVYLEQSDYERSLSYHLKALNAFERIGDKGGIAGAYTNIGNMYGEWGRYEQSLRYLFKGLETCLEIRDTPNIAAAYTNIGCTYAEQRKYNHALEYHLKAERIYNKIGNKRGVAISCNGIAECYDEQGAYKKALEYCIKGLEISEAIEYGEGTTVFHQNIGHLHILLKNYDQALMHLEKGLKLAKQLGLKKSEMESSKFLSELYEAKKDFKKALEYYKISIEVKEDIFNAEANKQIAEMKTKYEMEKSEREAEMYQLKNVNLNREIRKRKKVEKELKKHRDHLQQLVQERTAQLRSLAHELSLVEEKQRRKIATYLHDEVNQKLALAAFKLDGIEQVKAVAKIRKEHKEIKQIIDQAAQLTRSLTFEISPPILYEFGLESAIEWLVRQFGKQNRILCSFQNDGAPKPVTDDIRILLFQSVRELLANVSKHACASNVKVSTFRDDNVIRIKVKDDGVGFDKQVLNEKIARNEGFGLFNVMERLQYIRGRLEIKSTKGQGTSVVIVAPLQNVKKEQVDGSSE